MNKIGLLQYQPVFFGSNDFKGELAGGLIKSNDVAIKFWMGKAQVDIPFFVSKDKRRRFLFFRGGTHLLSLIGVNINPAISTGKKGITGFQSNGVTKFPEFFIRQSKE